MKKADHRKLESIAEDLFVSLPVLIRRVTKDSANLAGRKHDPSHFLLAAIMRHGQVPMSAIGSHMGISRPYMTSLVDKLIAEGYVKRVPDADDRRVINVAITKVGRDALAEFKKTMRDAVVRNLSSLSPDDISALEQSMKTIRDISFKLSKDKPKMREH